jgi:hypothetical protein
VVADLLPKLRSPNAEPALRTAAGARGWRILLLEFLASPTGAGEIVRLGDGSASQSDLADVPADLVLDRCYLHALPDAPQKRGIALNSASTIIRNSWIAEIKAVGQDSQAIAGWNGPGPYTISNNYLEAAGQAFMLGGSDPFIPNLVPEHLTFQGNYVTRPAEWRGGRWQVKNLFELKNARNAWIQGNLFENNWRAAQAGYAILFTPRNPGNSPSSTVEDVHFRYNVIRHVSAGISVLGHDSPRSSGTARQIEVAHNLFYDMDGSRWGGNGSFLLIGDGPEGMVVEHNTVLQSGNILSAYGGSRAEPAAARGFVFRFNLVRHNAYGVHGDGRGVGNDSLSSYFPSAIFDGNVIAGGSSSLYPSGNSFLSPSSFDALFADLPAGDFHVTGAVKVSADGSPVGADIDEVNRAWQAAQAGTWRDSPRFKRERERPRIDKGKGDQGE